MEATSSCITCSVNVYNTYLANIWIKLVAPIMFSAVSKAELPGKRMIIKRNFC